MDCEQVQVQEPPAKRQKRTRMEDVDAFIGALDSDEELKTWTTYRLRILRALSEGGSTFVAESGCVFDWMINEIGGPKKVLECLVKYENMDANEFIIFQNYLYSKTKGKDTLAKKMQTVIDFAEYRLQGLKDEIVRVEADRQKMYETAVEYGIETMLTKGLDLS